MKIALDDRRGDQLGLGDLDDELPRARCRTPGSPPEHCRPGPGRAARRPTGSRACAAARRRFGLGVLQRRAWWQASRRTWRPSATIRPSPRRAARTRRAGRGRAPGAPSARAPRRRRCGRCPARRSAGTRRRSLALDGLREFLLDAVPPQHRIGHRGLEELIAALALRLGLVHGEVRVADELIGVAALSGCEAIPTLRCTETQFGAGERPAARSALRIRLATARPSRSGPRRREASPRTRRLRGGRPGPEAGPSARRPATDTSSASPRRGRASR